MTTEPHSPETRIFNLVKRHRQLNEVLDRNGFGDPKPFDRVRNPREWLKFEKPDWFLPRGSRIDTVYVYFASFRRGDFRLCVDVDPHRVMRNALDDPERHRQRTEQLEVKAALMRDVRDRLMADKALARHVHFSNKNLRDPHRPSTITAVKFKLAPDAEAPPEETARAMAAVIDKVTPSINRILRGWLSVRRPTGP